MNQDLIYDLCSDIGKKEEENIDLKNQIELLTKNSSILNQTNENNIFTEAQTEYLEKNKEDIRNKLKSNDTFVEFGKNKLNLVFGPLNNLKTKIIIRSANKLIKSTLGSEKKMINSFCEGKKLTYQLVILNFVQGLTGQQDIFVDKLTYQSLKKSLNLVSTLFNINLNNLENSIYSQSQAQIEFLNQIENLNIVQIFENIDQLKILHNDSHVKDTLVNFAF